MQDHGDARGARVNARTEEVLDTHLGRRFIAAVVEEQRTARREFDVSRREFVELRAEWPVQARPQDCCQENAR